MDAGGRRQVRGLLEILPARDVERGVIIDETAPRTKGIIRETNPGGKKSNRSSYI